MEESGGCFEGISSTAVRKKRSIIIRRPRSESRPFPESRDFSSSSTPSSDDTSKVSGDGTNGTDNSSSRKDSNLSVSASHVPAPSGPDGEKLRKKNRKEDVSLDVLYSSSGIRGDSKEWGGSGLNQKRSNEGVLAFADTKSANKLKISLESKPRTMVVALGSSCKESSDKQSSQPTGVNVDGSGNQSKVTRVRLKVGGSTRTIDANPSSKSSQPANYRRKLILKGTTDEDFSPSDMKGSLQGAQFSRGFSSRGKEDSSMGKISGHVSSVRQGDKSDPVRKSRRVPKKRVIDEAFDEDDEDEEIRYLEKLKNARFAAGCNDEEESSRKRRRLSKVSATLGENVTVNVPQWSGKEARKKSPSYDVDYAGEEEAGSDSENEGRKKPKKEPADSVVEPKRDLTLTTRQRAMQSGKDALANGGSVIEFPNGLPPAPSRKQKEKLTDVEQQLKKAEAAQRRRMQNEKAAKESQAEAIRKILGQDSNRRKREEKKKKRQEEMAQEKAADALVRASTTVRWTMGPSGTIVTFPNDGLPSIFDPKPCSYPPPREKCAGPGCTNPYKYRDSKTKIPLCSLKCYKAVQVTSVQQQGESDAAAVHNNDSSPAAAVGVPAH